MILIPSSSTSLEIILSFAQKFRIYSLSVTWAIIFLFIRPIFTMWKPITPIIVFQTEQTTQWPKEKVQKDKQRSTKYTYKAKDRVTRTPLKTGDELRCSGRVCSSYSTSDISCDSITYLEKDLFFSINAIRFLVYYVKI
jgi:hypothetical protein